MIDIDAAVGFEILAMAQEGDPWARLWRAMVRGTGLRLTADEVGRLSMDQAIIDCAVAEAEDRLDAREGES
jgi:recombinational DNA repair protein RecT